MADSDGRIAGNGHLQSGGQHGQQPEDGGLGGRVVQPVSEGLEGHAGDGDDRSEPGRIDAGAGGPVAAAGRGNAADCGLAHAGHGTGCPEQRDELQERDRGHRQPSPWDRYDLIPCRDGKARRIMSRLALLVNGIQCSMAGSLGESTAEGEAQEKVDATITTAGRSEGVPEVQHPARKKKVRGNAGGQDGVLEAEVLQPGVHGSGDGGSHQSPDAEEQPKTIPEEGKAVVREVRQVGDDDHAARPPCQREPARQRRIELDDALRFMPSAHALAVAEGDTATAEALRSLFPASVPGEPVQHASFPEMAAWQPPSDEAVERAWRAGLLDGFGIATTAPLTKNYPGRAIALRGFGNAIVPQLAAEFVSAFMETQGVDS